MKNVILGLVLLTGLGVACQPQTTPDPDHGVSNASYRQGLIRVQTNTAAIISRLQNAKAAAIADPSVARSSDWWDALIREHQANDSLMRGVLTGETK